jgi:hypothetical protein
VAQLLDDDDKDDALGLEIFPKFHALFAAQARYFVTL